MRFHDFAIAALVIVAPALPAYADVAGTVAIIEGNAYAQKGEIFYTRPAAGQEIKVNQFGQYKDTKPAPAYVKWEQNTRRHLRPNDTIEEGEIIQTMGDGWLKILFKDDSLMDIGPAAMVQVQKFSGAGNQRNVLFKLLYGKVRGVVARPLAGPERYQLLTPTALMGVRGTEFLVNVFPDQEHKNQTEIICLHGQVSVDVTTFNEKGLVYTQPMVVNPGMMFATSGVHGLSEKTSLRSLHQEALRSMVARIGPGVNTRATVAGIQPPPTRLPGTGMRLDFYADTRAPLKAKKDLDHNSFDTDHPPADRMIASASDNFAVPHNFKDAPGAFGNIHDPRNITGPPPAQFLPATTSNVHINLNGIH